MRYSGINGVKFEALIAVKPTTIKSKIAKTFKITKPFSTRAALETPRLIKIETKRIETREMTSMIPPLLPNAFDNEFGSLRPNGAISARKLAESPDPTKARAMKYSARSAHPATQPQNSPKTTLIHE